MRNKECAKDSRSSLWIFAHKILVSDHESSSISFNHSKNQQKRLGDSSAILELNIFSYRRFDQWMGPNIQRNNQLYCLNKDTRMTVVSFISPIIDKNTKTVV